LNTLNKSWGDARPNSGPKKGAKYAKTISKELAREALRQIVLREMEELVAAQIAQAKGIKYLVTRDRKTGKYVRVTEAMARARKLGPNEELIEVWEKDPSVQAFTDLMNRALDKPKEQEQQINLASRLDIVSILRQRQNRRSDSDVLNLPPVKRDGDDTAVRRQ